MTDLALQEEISIRDNIQEMPKLYIHKCITCKLLFNDTIPSNYVPFEDYTYYLVHTKYGEELNTSSQCKRCLKEYMQFLQERLKNVSEGWVSDNLAINGEVMKKPEETK